MNGYALFAGRLSPEKRIVRSDQSVGARSTSIPLLIVGGGPGEALIKQIVGRGHLSNVQLIGAQPRKELLALMKRARLLLVPSEWYETFGMVIIEAFACGIPVFASRLGAMAELIEDGKTGRLFTPGSIEEIRQCGGMGIATSYRTRSYGTGRAERFRNEIHCRGELPSHDESLPKGHFGPLLGR